MLNQIIARRDEMALASKLGVRRIPGTGLTVNVPVDAEADGEFITKAEAAAYDLDAPAIGQVPMTLVKYTKQIKLSEELLEDEDANLMSFLTDWIARGLAKTQNELLLAAVAAGGSTLKTFAGAAAVAIGELEDIVANDDLANYLDDTGSVGFVMKPSTYWYINKLASANMRYYAESNASGSVQQKTLLGYPVEFSAKSGAITTGQKSIYFGNWNFVGMREGTGLQVLRDPYSSADTGQVNLWYRFRTVFKVLQSEAIGFAVQA
jgi:HK97 family phage major capsid protein